MEINYFIDGFKIVSLNCEPDRSICVGQPEWYNRNYILYRQGGAEGGTGAEAAGGWVAGVHVASDPGRPPPPHEVGPVEPASCPQGRRSGGGGLPKDAVGDDNIAGADSGDDDTERSAAAAGGAQPAGGGVWQNFQRRDET